MSNDEMKQEEFANIEKLTYAYFVKHGCFPSKVRVGHEVGIKIFPHGSKVAVTPDFNIELDMSLNKDEIVLDP